MEQKDNMELRVVRKRCPVDGAVLYLTVNEDDTPIWQCPECTYYEFNE